MSGRNETGKAFTKLYENSRYIVYESFDRVKRTVYDKKKMTIEYSFAERDK